MNESAATADAMAADEQPAAAGMQSVQDQPAAAGRQPAAGEQPSAEQKVLTSDEVNALLDGLETGSVEIRSAAGPQLAVVTAFEISQRCRLHRERLPNLDKIMGRLSGRLSAETGQLLQCEVDVEPRNSAERALEAISECRIEPIVAVQFSAAPLQGCGALLLEWELVDRIVEEYFGGGRAAARSERSEGFTYGELRVARSFATMVLESFRDFWQPLQEIEPEIVKTEQSMQALEIAADTDRVIQAGFDFSFTGKDAALHVLLPSAMVADVLPYLRGSDRSKDPDTDRFWSTAIRARLRDVSVDVAATVGDVTMTLGELVRLQPGDVVPIGNPSNAILRTQGAPLMAARFGVHAGRNAVETTVWLPPEQ